MKTKPYIHIAVALAGLLAASAALAEIHLVSTLSTNRGSIHHPDQTTPALADSLISDVPEDINHTIDLEDLADVLSSHRTDYFFQEDTMTILPTLFSRARRDEAGEYRRARAEAYLGVVFRLDAEGVFEVGGQILDEAENAYLRLTRVDNGQALVDFSTAGLHVGTSGALIPGVEYRLEAFSGAAYEGTGILRPNSSDLAFVFVITETGAVPTTSAKLDELKTMFR